jgi:hypothetical protein
MPADHWRHSTPLSAVPKPHRYAPEIQVYGTVTWSFLLISEVLRSNEQQVWCLSEHLVDLPITAALSEYPKRFQR